LSYDLGHEVNAMNGLLNASNLLHDLYKRKGDVNKSLAFIEEHLTYQKESFNSEIRDELYKSSIRNTFEKKILQDSITYVRDLEQKDAALTSAKKGRILLSVILIITIALLVISIRLYRVHKERSKLIEEENLRLSAEVQKLLDNVSNEGKKLNPDELGLSKRQMEILELIKQGKSNKEIADVLFISVNTVKYHLKAIYEALDIEHRSHAKLL
jgi:DNA-binding CsgD family transcriptional regulator